MTIIFGLRVPSTSARLHAEALDGGRSARSIASRPQPSGARKAMRMKKRLVSRSQNWFDSAILRLERGKLGRHRGDDAGAVVAGEAEHKLGFGHRGRIHKAGTGISRARRDRNS